MKILQKFLKQIMIKQLIMGALVLFFVVVPASYTQAYAQAGPTGPSIAGDSVCGGGGTVKDKDGNERVANPCTIQDLGKVVKGLLALVVSIGLPLLIVFVSYRFIMAYFALMQGNANAYKEALEKAGNAVFGFVIIILLIGGFLFVALRFLGVDERVLKIFEFLSDASRGAFIQHAYAATGNYLPNFLSVDNLYDFMLTVLRFIMRFFVYPAMIVIWVVTGFSFIFAQGNPAKIVTAKKWLIGAFITTFAIFMIQTFLIAIRGTVQNILPGGSSEASPSPGVTNQVSADQSTGGCAAGYHRDTEARQCVLDTKDTTNTAPGSNYGSGDPYLGPTGDLTPISPTQVKPEPAPAPNGKPTPVPGDIDPEPTSDVNH